MTTAHLEYIAAQYWDLSTIGLLAARRGTTETTARYIHEMALIVGEPDLPKSLREAARKSAVAMANLCPAAMNTALQSILCDCRDILKINHEKILAATGHQAELDLEERDIEQRRQDGCPPVKLTFGGDVA